MTFTNTFDAEEARRAMDEKMLGGRPIRVRFARPRRTDSVGQSIIQPRKASESRIDSAARAQGDEIDDDSPERVNEKQSEMRKGAMRVSDDERCDILTRCFQKSPQWRT